MFVGLDGTSREIREKRLGIRRYDRQASRNIHSQPLCHERFDGFVFERMIGLHHQSSPDMQSVRACGNVEASLSNSPLTSMRNAWKTRLAGLPAGRWACGTTSSTRRLSCAVVVNGSLSRRATMRGRSDARNALHRIP